MKEMLCLLMCVSIFIAGCNSSQANSCSAHLPADEPDFIENTWEGLSDSLEDIAQGTIDVLWSLVNWVHFPKEEADARQEALRP